MADSRMGMASRKEKFQAESGVKRSSCRRQFANNHDDDRYLVRVMPVQLSLSMFVSCEGTCDDSSETILRFPASRCLLFDPG